MKKKYLISIVLFLVVILIAPIFSANLFEGYELEENELINYRRVGGTAGYYDNFSILIDGTVVSHDFQGNVTEVGQLSQSHLDTLTKYIDEKQFSKKRAILILEIWDALGFSEPIPDWLYEGLWVNYNSKTIKITFDGYSRSIFLDYARP